MNAGVRPQCGLFPGIWTKVFERPSNRYLEGDFYIVYVKDRALVLFQKNLSLFTLLFTGNIPRGVFCEQRSQKTRDILREFMRSA